MQSSALDSLLKRQQPGHSLTREFYTDEELFEHELQTLFYQEWLFVIPACDIPKSGDYVTHTVGSHSIVIVRGTDGDIRAFHNVCRHRGSILCSRHQGNAPKLVCPYHQWTYELDGRLLFARDMGADFQRDDHGLLPVHCRRVSGMVFICLAQDAPELDDFEVSSAHYLQPHALEDAKVAHSSTIVESGNWKLVFENNRECYHCSGNHPELCRTFLDDPAAIGNSAESNMLTEAQAHISRCEDGGVPARFQIDPTGRWRYVRMPLIGQSESYTMDGKAAVSRPLGHLPVPNSGVLLMFHYPTTWTHFLSDHTLLFRVTPLSPTTTEVTTFWLVHKDAEEGRDYELDTLTRVWTATNSEDRFVVEQTQKGVESPAYTPGPCSPVHEGGVIQFLQWYTDSLRTHLTTAPHEVAV